MLTDISTIYSALKLSVALQLQLKFQVLSLFTIQLTFQLLYLFIGLSDKRLLFICIPWTVATCYFGQQVLSSFTLSHLTVQLLSASTQQLTLQLFTVHSICLWCFNFKWDLNCFNLLFLNDSSIAFIIHTSTDVAAAFTAKLKLWISNAFSGYTSKETSNPVSASTSADTSTVLSAST